jgi:hypothetical protein
MRGRGQYPTAAFVRRLLRHRQFNTEVKRLATVIRLSLCRLGCGVFMPRKKSTSIGQVEAPGVAERWCCSRLPTASAAFRLPAAAEHQRSALKGRLSWSEHLS